MESLNLENVEVGLASDGDLVVEGLCSGVCVKPKDIPLLRDWLLKHFPQPHDGWIKCADGLPRDDGEYLATVLSRTTGRRIIFDSIKYESPMWIFTHAEDIIAWRPLLDPYAGDP